MSDLIPIGATINSVEDYINTMKKLETNRGSGFINPAIITLQGKEGKFYESSYNQDKKEMEDKIFQDTTDGKFVFTPLIVCNYCEWKYAPDSPFKFRTREFMSTYDPIELLKITYKKDAKAIVETHSSYLDYQDFKAAYVEKDKLTGKEKSPYDFHIVVYGYHWASQRIVKIDLKGASRSSWFDFYKDETKAENLVEIWPQLRIELGSEIGGQMNDGSTFYKIAPVVAGQNDLEQMKVIMQATVELDAWMKKWKLQNKTQAAITANAPIEPVPTAMLAEPTQKPQEDEINLDDIPF